MRSLQIIEPQENVMAGNRGMAEERALQVLGERMNKLLTASSHVEKWVEVNGRYLNEDRKSVLAQRLTEMHDRLMDAVRTGGVKRFDIEELMNPKGRKGGSSH